MPNSNIEKKWTYHKPLLHRVLMRIMRVIAGVRLICKSLVVIDDVFSMYNTSDIGDSWYSGSIERSVLETEFPICCNCCVRNIHRKSKNPCSEAVVNT